MDVFRTGIVPCPINQSHNQNEKSAVFPCCPVEMGAGIKWVNMGASGRSVQEVPRLQRAPGPGGGDFGSDLGDWREIKSNEGECRPSFLHDGRPLDRTARKDCTLPMIYVL